MKKAKIILLLLLITSTSFSQKKDKIKGSKIVTFEQKQIESFNSLEVRDNIEVLLTKGTECAVEIEADDNLHDAIEIIIVGSKLQLSTLKDIISSKKLTVKVTYKDDFKSIEARNESTITALTDLELETMEIKSFDSSKLFINAKTTNLNLQCEDKSKTELNLKSEKSAVVVSKNAKLKALITSQELTFDMYQKAEATIEGDVNFLKLRLDNNSSFISNKLLSKITEITIESYSSAKINVSEKVIINASGKSEIQLFGDQTIEIQQLLDSAVLMKKPIK